MKTSLIIPIYLACAISGIIPLNAQDPAKPFAWTSNEGKILQATFIKLEGDSVVLEKLDKKRVKIPLDKLALASRNQARAIAAGGAAPPAADAGLQVMEFTKQNDPEHQRRLAESILTKKGQVEVWRGGGEISVAMLEELPKGKLDLKSVYATGAPFSAEDAAWLNGCSALARLRIFGANVETLPLGTLPKLEYLELYRTRLDAKALNGLRGSKALKEMNLWHLSAPIGGDPIPLLVTCPNLEVINLHKAGLVGSPIAPLSKLRFLKRVHLGGNNYSDADLAALAGFPALESLNLAESNLAGQSLDVLPKLKLTQSIGLDRCQLSTGIIGNVAKMPALGILQLYNSDVTDEMLSPLAGSKTLRELLVDETRLTGRFLIGLNPLPTLSILHLTGANTHPDDAVACALPLACPNLLDLSLNAKFLGLSGYRGIAALKKLAKLELKDGISLNEDAIVAILEIRGLATLGLGGSSISSPMVARLEPLKGKLTELRLGNTRVDDQSVEALIKFRALTSLTITGTDISKEGAERLRKALPACTVIY